MAKTLQFRRGNQAATLANTPAAGELFVNTDQNTLVVGNGSTAGGNPLATQSHLTSNVSILQGINTTQNTNITAVNGLAAGAYNTANGANGLAAGAYNTANGANGLAAGAYNTANTNATNITLVNQFAQSAYNQANTGSNPFDQNLNIIDDVVFNSSLIGDVSIVANTISAINSYGNPDTLVVDGKLQVKTGYPGTVQTTLPTVPGDVNILQLAQVPAKMNLILDIANHDSIQFLSAYQESDILTFEFTFNAYTYTVLGYIFQIDITSAMPYINLFPTLTSFTSDDPSYPSGNAINLAAALGVSQFYPTITFFHDGTVYTYPLSANSSGIVVTGDLILDGQLKLPNNTNTPSNSSTVVKWSKIIINGQTYYIPLYQ